MKKTFDQKWGSKILIAVVVIVSLYSFAPVVFGEWEEYYKTMDDSSGDKYKDNGQNLYYYVYDKVKVEPATAALESTATYFGYGTSDSNLDYVTAIVDGNTDGSLLGADPMTVFDSSASEYEEIEDLSTIQGRYEKSAVMKTYFYNALANESLRSELSVQTETNEMYANGDTSDSGFDLITDLKTIEYILFAGVTDTWTGDDSVSGDDDSAETDEDLTRSYEGEAVSATSDDTVTSESESESASTSDAVSAEGAEKSEEDTAEDISESKLECFDDDTLSGAISDFQESAVGRRR
ncbi:MAG: hypothetical protein UW03_C0024G0004 [Candidatus Peregrinibacteria bacterium GW2011_GWA2_43_8]|nr:MAG: hypothetical protein UW03_C0024G0004 [Candidatus Peregrinibacteria bacterium GW2011_GWA2_43_8]